MDTFELFKKARESYKGREYLYLFPTHHGTYNAVNYNAMNAELNSFLKLFVVNAAGGYHRLSKDNMNLQEVWFEVSTEFFEQAVSNGPINTALKRLKTRVVTEDPFVVDTDFQKDFKERWLRDRFNKVD